MATGTTRGRRLQILTERAGKRWSRRHRARMAERNPVRREQLRVLFDEAEVLFKRLKAIGPEDPFARMIAADAAKPVRNEDDPDDD